MTEKQHKLLAKLLKTYPASSTEALIGYLAAETGMLGACRALLEQLDAGDDQTITWLHEQCQRFNLRPQHVLTELRTIVTMFSPQHHDEEPHRVLGVPLNASRNDIKRAYRKLSLTCHPDTAADRSDAPDQFIRITRAYQTLLGERTEQPQPRTQPRTQHRQPHWRQQSKRSVSATQRRTLLAWTAGLLVLLVVISLVVANAYRKKTMLAGLQHHQGAFIPPRTSTSTSTIATTPIAVAAPPPPTAQPVVQQPAVPAKPPKPPEPPEPPKPAEPEPIEPPAVETPVATAAAAEPPQAGDPPAPLPAAVTTTPAGPAQPEALPAPEPDATTEPEAKEAAPTPTLPEAHLPPPALEIAAITAPAREQEQPEAEQKPAADQQVRTPSLKPAPAKADAQKEPPEAQPIDQPAAQSAEVVAKAEATAKPEPSAKAQTTPPVQPPLESRLHRFFDAYLAAYAQRNILSFSRFFSSDAVENDKPFATMVPTYLDLFEGTDAAALQLQDLDWQQTPAGVVVSGRFTVDLDYRDGHRITGTGPIRFLLQENEFSFLIETLDYTFDH